MRRSLGYLAPLALLLACASQKSASGGGDEAPSKEAAFVSPSGGEAGGLVVFWPRVIPRTDDPELRTLAEHMQNKMVQLARETFPDRAIDVRPEPQRVCPRGGCDAATFGVLLVHKGPKCAAVALMSPGQTATNDLTVWGGEVRLKLERVAFREYPEDHVAITEYMPCNDLMKAMTLNDETIVEALREKTQ